MLQRLFLGSAWATHLGVLIVAIGLMGVCARVAYGSVSCGDNKDRVVNNFPKFSALAAGCGSSIHPACDLAHNGWIV